ncbi:cysteine-rich KTR domain-containing protein [Gemmiger formicilis]|uniref:cysteine-rich KTR domain-containing protein n=1 Tax=Gemmiger formicilis TaxID=745368 RepID=UPI003CCB6476
MEKEKWVLCPICNNKTRIKVRPDTVLENFPLFCPKCKRETVISVKGLDVVAAAPERK